MHIYGKHTFGLSLYQKGVIMRAKQRVSPQSTPMHTDLTYKDKDKDFLVQGLLVRLIPPTHTDLLGMLEPDRSRGNFLGIIRVRLRAATKWLEYA